MCHENNDYVSWKLYKCPPMIGHSFDTKTVLRKSRLRNRGIEWFLKNHGSWKVLGESQNLGVAK